MRPYARTREGSRAGNNYPLNSVRGRRKGAQGRQNSFIIVPGSMDSKTALFPGRIKVHVHQHPEKEAKKPQIRAGIPLLPLPNEKLQPRHPGSDDLRDKRKKNQTHLAELQLKEASERSFPKT